jgi:hypothetical protein
MLQPPASNAAQRLGKAFVQPPSTNYSFWLRGSFNYRLGVAIPVGPPIVPVNNDNNINLWLSTNPFSTANMVQVSINESDAGTIQAEFVATVGGVPSLVTTTNLWNGAQISTSQMIEMVGIQMIGAVAHAWAVTTQGSAMYLGAAAFAPAANLALAGFAVINNSTQWPANMIMGVDCFRYHEGALFLP